MDTAHCYYCGNPADADNLVEVDGGIVRVCDNCKECEDIGGVILANKIEKKKPIIAHKSFDPEASWLAELEEIDKEQESRALVDESKLVSIYKELDRLKNQEEEFKKQLQEQMESRGIKSIKTDLFTITLTPEHKTDRLDQKALKAENPELFDKYVKQTTVKASVKITLKKEHKK